MRRWKIISTWSPTICGVKIASDILRDGGCAIDAVEAALREAESDENCVCVGFAGEANQSGNVQVDAGIMDGKNFSIGAVAGMNNYLHPISIARHVMEDTPHLLLVGTGAEKFATKYGYCPENLLSEVGKANWLKSAKSNAIPSGHDTANVIVLDKNGDIAVGASSTGLKYKMDGRVGDTALPGAGFYADNAIGAASTTGWGEEMMRICGSLYCVQRMADGLSPQNAALSLIEYANETLRGRGRRVGNIAIICMNKYGETGAACNHNEKFDYTCASDTEQPYIMEVSAASGELADIDDYSLT